MSIAKTRSTGGPAWVSPITTFSSFSSTIRVDIDRTSSEVATRGLGDLASSNHSTLSVDVDVSDTSGPRVGDKVRNQPLPKLDSDGDDPKVGALIDRIIAENGGASPVASAGGAGR